MPGKRRKVLKRLAYTVALLVLLLILFVLFWVGPTLKLVAQNIGTKALGTPVRIESLSIKPGRGLIDLKSFTIETHEGFNRTNTWELASLHINIDTRSLFTDTVIVHEILIDAPHFTYEHNQSSDNIAEIIKSLQAYSGADPEKTDHKKGKAGKKKKSEKAAKKVIVESLVINDLQVHMANTDDLELNTRLALDRFSLSFTNGLAQIRNLTLGNPESLATPNLFELKTVEVQVDPDSIYSDTLVIEDVQIRYPHAFLEINPETDTVAEFMKIFGGASGKTKKPPKAEEAATEPEEDVEVEARVGKSTQVELRNLYVDDIRIHVLDTTRTNAPSEPHVLASISGIRIEPPTGRLHITDVSVPSPEGFITTNLFHLENLTATVDPASLASAQTVITGISLESPRLTVEQNNHSGNATELQKTIMNLIPSSSSTGESSPPRPDETPADDSAETAPRTLASRPVLLESLLVTNLTMNMSVPGDLNPTVIGQMNKFNPFALFNPASTNSPDEQAVEAKQDTLHLASFDQLTVQPPEGLIRLRGLQLGNPPGFADENLLQLDSLRIELDPNSVLTDTVLVHDVLIQKPQVAFERKFSTDNIKALQAFVAAALETRNAALSGTPVATNTPAAESGDELPDEEPEVEEPESGGKKVVIEHLLVTKGTVRAKVTGLPTTPIGLPDIEKTDLGKEDGGATFGSVISSLYESFYDSIVGALGNITGFAADALKGVGDLILPGSVTEPEGVDPVTGEQAQPNEAEAGASEAPEPDAPADEEPQKKQRFWKRPGRIF